MCQIIEDYGKEREERAKITSTLNLLRLGKLSIEDIASVMGLPIEQVKELAAAQ